MKKMIIALLALVGWTHAAITASFSKNLSAVDSAITMSAGSYNSVSFQLDSTWVATVKFEGTVNGTKWTTVYAVNQKGGAVDSVATANGVYLLSGNGFKLIRARVSARSSGIIKIQAMANEGSGVVSLLNQSSAGASSNVAVTTSALPTGAATAANQTNAAQKTQVVDGSGNVIGATSNALDVNIKSGAASGAVAQGSTTSGQTGGLTQGAVTTAAPTYTTGQTNPLSMTTGGALRVDASAASLTVGTHAVTQSGTWTLQPGNTANTTAWLVTGTGGTFPASQSGTWNDRMQDGSGNALASSATTPGGTEQALITRNIPSGTQAVSGTVTANAGTGTMAVSAAALPLPSGAATSSNQSTTNTTLSAISGQLPAALDGSGNFKVSIQSGGGSGGTASSFGSAFPATGTAAGFLNSAGTNMAAGNLDASGYLKVNVAAGGGAGGTSSSFGSATPATGTAAGFSDGTNMQAPRAFDADAGAGTQYVAGVSLRKAASGGSVEAGTSSDPLRTDPTGTTTQPVSIATAPALVASSAVIGKVGIDQTTPGTTNLVALAANQTVNVAQINGVTPLMGNGVTGTGSQRVTIASDQTAFGVNLTQYTPVTGRLPVDPSGVTSPVSYATTGSGTATGAIRVELPTNGTGVIATVGAVTAITNALPAGSNAIGTVTTVGAAAHGSAVSGAPVRQGNRARTSDITAVSNDQTADQVATVDGKAVFMPYAIQGSRWSSAAASGGIVNTTGTTIKTAAGAGIRNCVTSIDIENGHATVSTEVVLRDGASGTVIKRWWAQAAGGGIAKQLPVPLCGTANTLLEVAAITTGSAIYVNAEGYTSAE